MANRFSSKAYKLYHLEGDIRKMSEISGMRHAKPS